MTKSKHTKKALLASMLSMLLCVAMLIGSTFAWFTDSVTSGNNKIAAGNLDIELEHMNAAGVWEDASKLAEGSLFNPDGLWEPGKVVYEQFRVVNKGSLAMKYFLTFRDIVHNDVLVPDGEGGYEYPLMSLDGEDTYMQLNLADVLQVAYYPGTMDDMLAELETAGVTASKDSRDIVTQAVDSGLISFFDDELGAYNLIFDNFELFGALAPAGVYKGEDGAPDDALDPVHLRYGLTGTSGSSIEVDDDGNQIFINVDEATDTQEYTIFLYWQPDFIPFWYDSDVDLDDNDYNLNNGKVATPLITDELEDEFSAECTMAVDTGLLTQIEIDTMSGGYWDFRLEYLKGKGFTNALDINFDIRAFATQIPHEYDSFDNTYDDEVDWPEVLEKEIIPPGKE